MKSIIHTVYLNGRAGLSNLIMSFELGVVMAALTDRVLILRGNHTPIANVVQYDGHTSNAHPSRITDLIDLGVPWIDADRIDLAAFVPHELCDRPAWDCVFCYPAHLSVDSDDFRSFANGRSQYITVDDRLERVPMLSFSGGTDGATLSFYSYFFYLDHAAQMTALDALRRFQPKSALAELAQRVAHDFGSFNAVHIRRGDFKVTRGVTILDRRPEEVVAALDDHFNREDCLVILTDDAHDPFFNEIKTTYRNHIFLDHYILDHYGKEFFDLPAHDSIALAYLSQLVAAASNDFIGSMTSTFTSLVQRMRGNQGKDEPFKFLWNELPEAGDIMEPGRHAAGNAVMLHKGVMVAERDGPYSWNRCNARLNPGWMREWPEGFLNETAMTERARCREVVSQDATASPVVVNASRDTRGGHRKIAFSGANVIATSDCTDTVEAIGRLFEMMVTDTGSEPIAEVRIEATEKNANLLVDGQVAERAPHRSILLRKAYREVVCRFIDRFPDLIWLHAGCAAIGEGAILLPGSWGRGKTSLVMALYERGWSFLSDDIAPLDCEISMVLPFPATPQLRPRPARELPRSQLGEIPKSGERLDPDRLAAGPTRLSMIVFPRYQRGAAVQLSSLSAGQAVGQLLENCLSFTKNEDATIRRLCTIVESLPVFQLQFGDNDEAAEVLIAEQAQRARTDSLTDTEILAERNGQTGEADMKNADRESPVGERQVNVEVTLKEGLRYSSTLSEKSQILKDLYFALATARDPQQALLVQMPLDKGLAACSFMSTSLVSVITRPAVLIRPPQVLPETSVAAPPLATPTIPATSAASVYIKIPDFLTPDENTQLLEYAVAHETQFEGSTTTTNVKNYRKSRVLHKISDTKWREIFMARLRLHLPHISTTLNVPGFRFGSSEIQLTASNDGDYFKPHADSSHDNETLANREITFVYYLFRTPKQFAGGNLLIYHGEPGQALFDKGSAVDSIAPENNCLIVFRSNQWHEVDMVRSASGAFCDSRFTINGWLRRAAS